MIHKKKTVQRTLCVCMILSLMNPWINTILNRLYGGNCVLLSAQIVKAEETGYVPVGVTNVNVRQQPSTSSGVLTKVNGGQILTVLDTSVSGWYKVTFEKSGTTYTGYISSDYVQLDSTSAASSSSSEAPSADGDFESALASQGFPESYKPYLRELHALHPEWKFTAVNTGLDWNTVIDHESNKQGQIKNLVQGVSSAPHYNWRETSVGYAWATDTWYPYDGTTWFAASKDLVAYYMDPRTYLYETYIFAFEQLSYDNSIHNRNGVEAILNGTFMYNSAPEGETKTYSELIMDAASVTGVSPYHLASRMKQEMGSTAGVNATGKSSAYPGIYNYFNIGASDSSGGGAVNKGLAWASMSGTYGRPWNTVAKSITGGAEYIGSSYINRGQDTLYTQKFNVTYTANLYSHQYMSNVQAPASEAATMFRAYKSNGLLNSALVFKIPVYSNMPEQAVSKPADSGSPNNWLKSLIVGNYSLTPTFTGGTTDYSIILDYSVTNVTVSATAVNGKAVIQGTGSTALQVGENKIPITVTAQNGTVRTYTVTILRKNADGSGTTAPGTAGSGAASLPGGYTVQEHTITGIAPGTNAADFVQSLAASGGTISVYQKDGVTVNDGKIGTGSIVKITNGGVTENYTCVIYGDVSGDGAVNALDLLKVQKHIIGASKLEGDYLTAANVKKSGSVSALDLLKIQKHIIGASELSQ
ncbi:MAG: SH3 domain-containing protein [Lachnospiraceae bacterium]|nr:SH3 domain-containing protein [Lachnospiraceae bacterium]